MSRRIEIELTSTKDDGTWTWRAAGAKQPKGVVDASVLPGGASVGDVLRVEVEMGLEGTEVTTVLPPKGPRAEPERLELATRDLSEDELVTSKLVGKRGRRDRDGDGDRRGGRRGGRDGRPGGRGDGRPGGRGDGRPGGGRDGRPGGRGRDGGGDGRGDRGPRGEGGGRGGPRPERGRRPRPDDKPKPKRLRPRRTHRKGVLDTLEVHERPIAEEVLRGGIPAVRQAVEKQNEQARAEGRPEVDPAQLEALAERLLPRLRTAEWRDRADAALADIDEIDLRDLRTVVVAADSAARDDETRALAAQLKEGLERRIEADQAAWLAEMASLLTDGRVVRALRVSSRPPKAGVPLPADLATRLTDAASASLTADTPTDRWATVLDALSLSPVHARVAPESLPAEPSDELKAAAAANGEKVPLVAQALGVEPVAPKRSRGPRRGGAKSGGKGGGPSRGPKGKGPDTRPVPPPPPAADTPEATAASPAVAEASAHGPTAPPAAEAPEAPTADQPAPEEATAAAPAVADASAEQPAPPAADAPEAPAPDQQPAEETTAAAPEVAEASAEEPAPPAAETPEAPAADAPPPEPSTRDEASAAAPEVAGASGEQPAPHAAEAPEAPAEGATADGDASGPG